MLEISPVPSNLMLEQENLLEPESKQSEDVVICMDMDDEDNTLLVETFSRNGLLNEDVQGLIFSFLPLEISMACNTAMIKRFQSFLHDHFAESEVIDQYSSMETVKLKEKVDNFAGNVSWLCFQGITSGVFVPLSVMLASYDSPYAVAAYCSAGLGAANSCRFFYKRGQAEKALKQSQDKDNKFKQVLRSLVLSVNDDSEVKEEESKSDQSLPNLSP